MPPLENMAISVLVSSLHTFLYPFAPFLGPFGPSFFTLFHNHIQAFLWLFVHQKVIKAPEAQIRQTYGSSLPINKEDRP